ncbi:DUF2474 domain-containing protein [Hyphomicrobium sp.]|jgi:hypothetical protein|uniref:DUF2474 domain-containing protein n=1 Tax=Hyphomicrobium sp. TaxID=82 RepID=UPI003563E58F
MPDDTGAGRVPLTRTERPTWVRRIGWLLLIWFLSVLALAVVAGLIRLLMTSAGLTV